MRESPKFPHYRVAFPPSVKRWLGFGSSVILLSGILAALIRRPEHHISIILSCMVGISIFIGVGWLIRMLSFRLSVHHSMTWSREVEYERKHWWEIHQRSFSLMDVVLIGPAGAELFDWLRVIKREQPVPPVRQEASGKVMRVARTFSSDLIEREKQLAQMLVLQWKKQRKDQPAIFPEKFFWLGSGESWRAFVMQLNECFPGMNIPESPERWLGEETLSLFAETFADGELQGVYLVAGCQSLYSSSDAVRPAGESAVLWLVGGHGDVRLTRGEFWGASDVESLQQIVSRAEKQSEPDESPDKCILFSHPLLPELADCGWNVTHNTQDEYWGESGKLDALIVISLAAMSARSEKEPCAWIASDPLHTLALGIVKPHGNR